MFEHNSNQELSSYQAEPMMKICEKYLDYKLALEVMRTSDKYAKLFKHYGGTNACEAKLKELRQQILDDENDILQTISAKDLISMLDREFEKHKRTYLEDFMRQHGI